MQSHPRGSLVLPNVAILGTHPKRSIHQGLAAILCLPHLLTSLHMSGRTWQLLLSALSDSILTYQHIEYIKHIK